MLEIKDRLTAEAWLADQPYQTRIWTAARVLLRALPLAEIETDHISDSERLIFFRTTLIAYCISIENSPIDDLRQQAALVRRRMTSLEKHFEVPPGNIFKSIAEAIETRGKHSTVMVSHALDSWAFFLGAAQELRSAGLLQDNDETDFGTQFEAIQKIQTSEAYERTYSEFAEDASDAISDAGLWKPRTKSQRIEDAILSFRVALESGTGEWNFWLEWFEGQLEGAPIEADLLLRLALEIPNKLWNAGAVEVAEKIETIRAKMDLEKRIEALEAERNALLSQVSRHGIGGNAPPEDMQIERQIVRETTIIWAAVDELKAETEKEAPDPTKLEKSAEAIESVKRSWGQFFAQKLEISTDEFFKEFGKWSGRLATASLPAGALLLLETLGKLEPLLQALRNYISILVG